MADLVLPAVLTQAEAAGALRLLTQALRQAAGGPASASAAPAAAPSGPVVVDASALQAFDSSALAVLLACRREALAAGHAFAVRGLPERLRVLAGLYGVQELLPN